VNYLAKAFGVGKIYTMAFAFRRWFTRTATPGVGVKLNQAEAVGAEVQFQRGLDFARGRGVAQDYAQAAQWYAQAAEQDHSPAQFNLAMLYRRGEGVVRDEAKSLLWLTKAAKLGNAAAQYELGIHEHLASRQGRTGATTVGRIEALKWVRLSAPQGYRAAEGACEFVALGMTWEEVAESARRAGSFVAG